MHMAQSHRKAVKLFKVAVILGHAAQDVDVVAGRH
jgi:hypothetical protein